MPEETASRFVVSVLVPDRVGILRDIVTPLTEMGANIDGISQTVVGGYFTVILTSSFDEPRTTDSVLKSILDDFTAGEASVVVRPHTPAARPAATTERDRYIVTITGPDRPGILKMVTGFLAAKRVNIEDWYFEYQQERVTHIGEITVPARLDVKQVQDEFRQMLAKVGMTASIQHENIFRATNEIGAISPLLGEGRSHA